MSNEQISELTNVVKETMAAGFYQPEAKIFTAADLWNIQRNGVRRMQRRSSF